MIEKRAAIVPIEYGNVWLSRIYPLPMVGLTTKRASGASHYHTGHRPVFRGPRSPSPAGLARELLARETRRRKEVEENIRMIWSVLDRFPV